MSKRGGEEVLKFESSKVLKWGALWFSLAEAQRITEESMRGLFFFYRKERKALRNVRKNDIFRCVLCVNLCDPCGKKKGAMPPASLRLCENIPNIPRAIAPKRTPL